jgi:DDE superfamily endonuclease
VHLIVDHYATHKHPKVRTWLGQHQRFHFHFTPTSASRLNAVEGFFAKLTPTAAQTRRLHRHRRPPSRHQLLPAPDPRQSQTLVWTADPDAIIEKVRRGKQVLESLH